MRISIVAVGKIKEKYLTVGISEFLKRLTPYCRFEIIEVSEERMPDNPSTAEKMKVLNAEGDRIIKQLRGNSQKIALDVAGQSLSSEELAAKFSSFALAGKSDIMFIIGGAFGLGTNVLKSADEIISFSRMTFTHQMIRLLLVEQIYRAFKINRGEKYHW